MILILPGYLSDPSAILLQLPLSSSLTDDEVLVALKSLDNSSIISKLGDKQLDVKVRVMTQDTMKSFYKKALIDLGYSSLCISKRFFQENQINI